MVKAAEERPWNAIVHIGSCLFPRVTVDYTATLIQCMVRQQQARKKLAVIVRLHRCVTQLSIAG